MQNNSSDFLDESSYLSLMLPWLNTLPRYLRSASFEPALSYYGLGDSAHWSVQSNMNIFASLAVMATSAAFPEKEAGFSREEIINTALSLLRYSLATHLTGNKKAIDGKQWGCHWISVLGMERMAHGIDAIKEYLTDEDQEALRKIMLAESDWRLDHFEPVAGMVGAEGNNKPESNIWNGAVLLRSAIEYPDSARVEEYLEKAALYLLNGLSHPLDAASEKKYRSKELRKWHIGFNFTPNWSLDHHSYLNVGYMIICLSNLAMLHFFYKSRGLKAPEEVYLHIEDLWPLVKNFTFPDGRLLRIGGDTRARYTYCQNYCIPSWLLAADLFSDKETANFEQNWLQIIKKEQDYSADGGFYTKRLADLQNKSYYYFTRLESDAILSLSYGAYWRRLFELPQPEQEIKQTQFSWKDEFHGANFIRNQENTRSFVWHSAQGPSGLICPLSDSSFAEWQGNLHGELFSAHQGYLTQGEEHSFEMFTGGFINYGKALWREQVPLGEGEAAFDYAEHQIACVALPDAKSLIILEYAKCIHEVTLKTVKGACIKIPNDLFNDFERSYYLDNGKVLKNRNIPEEEEIIELSGNNVNIDNKLNVSSIYGAEKELLLFRPAERNIIIKSWQSTKLNSLYAEEICTKINLNYQKVMPETVLLDDAIALSACKSGEAPNCKAIEQKGLLRTVEITSENKKYFFAANFADQEATVKLPEADYQLLAGKEILAPGAAALWSKNCISD